MLHLPRHISYVYGFVSVSVGVVVASLILLPTEMT
jgi:hypothetical protein